MSPDIVAVPIAEVGKLLASATDERYQVAVLLAIGMGSERSRYRCRMAPPHAGRYRRLRRRAPGSRRRSSPSS